LGIATVLTTSVSVLTLSNQVFALSMQNGKIRSQVAGTHSPWKAQNGAGNKRLSAILMDNIPLFGQLASNSGHVGHPVTALNSVKTVIKSQIKYYKMRLAPKKETLDMVVDPLTAATPFSPSSSPPPILQRLPQLEFQGDHRVVVVA
jgi:hypothetical protein